MVTWRLSGRWSTIIIPHVLDAVSWLNILSSTIDINLNEVLLCDVLSTFNRSFLQRIQNSLFIFLEHGSILIVRTWWTREVWQLFVCSRCYLTHFSSVLGNFTSITLRWGWSFHLTSTTVAKWLVAQRWCFGCFNSRLVDLHTRLLLLCHFLIIYFPLESCLRFFGCRFLTCGGLIELFGVLFGNLIEFSLKTLLSARLARSIISRDIRSYRKGFFCRVINWWEFNERALLDRLLLFGRLQVIERVRLILRTLDLWRLAMLRQIRLYAQGSNLLPWLPQDCIAVSRSIVGWEGVVFVTVVPILVEAHYLWRFEWAVTRGLVSLGLLLLLSHRIIFL